MSQDLQSITKLIDHDELHSISDCNLRGFRFITTTEKHMTLRLTEVQVKSVVDEVLKFMDTYAEEMNSQDDARSEEGFIPLTREIMWYDNIEMDDIFEIACFDLEFCQEKVENSMDDIIVILNKLLAEK